MALEILKAGRSIDLLITDQSMPGMSGAELVKEARLLNPDIAVVVSTGYSDLPGEFQSGTQFLSKPYSEVDLAATIQAAMR